MHFLNHVSIPVFLTFSLATLTDLCHVLKILFNPVPKGAAGVVAVSHVHQ